MMDGPIPVNYEQWRHCISVECGLELSPAFIEQRLKVWKDEQAQETRRFRQLYGVQYLAAVVSWFERAQKEAS
ncbi:MAG: hypothetical protein AAF290_11240 [Pseudomonadota bacterium]